MLASLWLTGCASRSKAFAPPAPPNHGSSANSSGHPDGGLPPPDPYGLPVDSGPSADAQLYFEVEPGPFDVGQEVRMELMANGPLSVPANRTVDVVLIKPDRTRLTNTIDIGPQEYVTYCLPTRDQQGCEHDRQIEPFDSVMLAFGPGRSPFDQPGTYTLILVDPKRELRASRVPIEISERSTVSGRPKASVFPSSIQDFALKRQMSEHIGDPAGVHHGAVYHHRAQGSSKPVQVEVFDVARRDDVARLISKLTARHQKRGLQSARAIDGLPCLASRDGTSHFVGWISGERFVVAIYVPKGDRADVQHFVRSLHEQFPATAKRKR